MSREEVEAMVKTDNFWKVFIFTAMLYMTFFVVVVYCLPAEELQEQVD